MRTQCVYQAISLLKGPGYEANVGLRYSTHKTLEGGGWHGWDGGVEVNKWMSVSSSQAALIEHHNKLLGCHTYYEVT